MPKNYHKTLLIVACCAAMATLTACHATRTARATPHATQAIAQLLTAQTQAWNDGNLEEFMQGYLPTDSLKFVGKKGLTYGWQPTLDNYKSSYADTVQMGKLHFDIIETNILAPNAAFVIGKWHLQRTIGDISGHFTLLLRKIKGKWYITTDHSS
jgi:ketosteroid isomerase-like protein